MTSFYDEDLAYVHHVGFSNLAENGGAQLLSLMAEDGLDSGLVIDLGCGAGEWARLLVRAGFEVLGYDVSEHMVRLARQTAPDAAFECASLYAAELRPSVAITALGEALNYATSGDAPTDVALGGLFRRVAKCLQPGGLFAFDVIVQSDDPPMNYRTWRKGEDWAVMGEVAEDAERHVLVRDSTIFREHDGAWRRSEERHEVLVLNAERLTELLSDAGFDVSVGTSYGSHELLDRRRAFLARRV
jgi:SAM-dependent methyltransferase